MAYPQLCHAEPQIKIHRIYNFYSPYASPLVIIDNEEQYKYFIDNSKIYGTDIKGWESEFYDSSNVHSKIDFKNQCLFILSAPSLGAPRIKTINNKNSNINIDVEYSEYTTWNNGEFHGTGVVIDRQETPIKLSEKSLRQHEKLYGNKLQCYRNSLNNTFDNDILKTRKKIIIKIFNDIYSLKRQYRELKNFNLDNARDPETKETMGIYYKQDFPKLFLHILIEHPLREPYEPGILGPSFSYAILEEYENICTKVEARIYTNNRTLKDKMIRIIKKRLAPLDKLNGAAN